MPVGEDSDSIVFNNYRFYKKKTNLKFNPEA